MRAGKRLLVLAGFCFLVGCSVAVIVGFDWWLYAEFGVDATISRCMEWLGGLWPWIPFVIGLQVGLVIGLLGGHFFWPQPPMEDKR